jgi:hypothetical protein
MAKVAGHQPHKCKDLTLNSSATKKSRVEKRREEKREDSKNIIERKKKLKKLKMN